ncbi:MliC family protein [Leptotrichia sp. oral taxon 221]|jgi:hypothetical protein cdivTM_01921|uniref:MliC family protein n=1 Tax=Leptotrichia sp. oral taxon 221 TaxID=712362 RepID=UPI001B8B8A3C|nr:MliC family protein [Leptotrichia sp. oral taxon 221]QUB96434.1 MliC family protein [Leptotrichia sp. oral taxon 221]
MKSTKKIILTALIGVLALGSIGYAATKKTSNKKAESKVASAKLTRKFTCDNRSVTVENLSTDRVKLTESNGKSYNLKLTRSASGEEYKGSGVSIHIKGNEAAFTKNGQDEACSMTQSNADNNTASSHLLRKFDCEGYQDVTVENLSTDKVRLADGYGSIYDLNSAVAASGEKYSNGNISIHMKGNEAVYTENGKDKSCSLKSTGKGSIEQ